MRRQPAPSGARIRWPAYAAGAGAAGAGLLALGLRGLPAPVASVAGAFAVWVGIRSLFSP